MTLRQAAQIGRKGEDLKGLDGISQSRADDGSRTRYLELGKLALYQVSYVRSWA